MIINTREDLDAIQGTEQYDKFMLSLRSTLFSFELDEDLKEWVLVEDNKTIEAFGFTRADFEPIK